MIKKIILLTIILVGLYSCKRKKEKFYNTTVQDEIRKKLSSPSTGVFPPYDEIKDKINDTKFYEKEINPGIYKD